MSIKLPAALETYFVSEDTHDTSAIERCFATNATVRDEGPGFDVSAVAANYAERGSLGMVNMRDRARLVEGKLVIDSAPGKGARVTLTVPLNDRRNKSRSDGKPK